jgi:uncharacterized protein (DUF885 family)
MVTPAGTSSVTALADDLVQLLFEADPLFASLSGVHDHDAELADLTEAGQQALAGRLRQVAAAAQAVDPAGLAAADRLTREVVGTVAADQADVLAAGGVEWQVTDLWVAPAARVLADLPLCTVPEPEHAAAYLRRLAALDGYLAAAADRHEAGVAADRAPVARLVRAAIEQLDGYLAAPAADPLAEVAPPAGWAGADGFRHEVAAVLEGSVRPAFRRYRGRLAGIEPAGRGDDRAGLCWLPGGEDAYRTLVRAHTTAPRGPDELHHTGLELLARLAEEYAEIGSRVFGSTDPAEVMRRMRDDPALRCTSAEQMLADARAAVARAEEAAPRWFGRVPAQQCVVAAVPAADEARAVFAYYIQPALDGSRPGTYWQYTRDPAGQHQHVLEFTAFHEAVPGHHLQLALTQGRPDLPLLRRVFEFDGHGEGWALYCERLADEMGLYTGDIARLGMLSGDSLRASRLVVDTGLHALGWSRAQAVDFLRANTPLAPADVEVEIDRYLAGPGQALAYMVGRLEIQRLRADAERRLGAAFDIRAFHDVVLGAGALPLSTLDTHVGEWLADAART